MLGIIIGGGRWLTKRSAMGQWRHHESGYRASAPLGDGDTGRFVPGRYGAFGGSRRAWRIPLHEAHAPAARDQPCGVAAVNRTLAQYPRPPSPHAHLRQRLPRTPSISVSTPAAPASFLQGAVPLWEKGTVENDHWARASVLPEGNGLYPNTGACDKARGAPAQPPAAQVPSIAVKRLRRPFRSRALHLDIECSDWNNAD